MKTCTFCGLNIVHYFRGNYGGALPNLWECFRCCRFFSTT